MALGGKLIWRTIQNSQTKWAIMLFNINLSPNEPLSILRTKNLPRGSNLWHCMLTNRPFILNKVTWKIGRGVRFQTDSWVGYLIISKIISIHLTRTILEERLGPLLMQRRTRVPNRDGNGNISLYSISHGLKN